ncbi:MAG TPA: tRNA (adenosine(37)-N6)-threonylcarbamoyltransferase complex dimerization subunit type 1 TsaB [Anaerolineales bacterium]
MLLAIDTSTAQVGVALFDGTQPAIETTWSSRVHHTVELAPAVIDLLRRAGAAIDDVEAIGVAIGPGSFTALRVGMAFAKGLAVARRLPVLGIPTLDVLAGGQPASDLPLAAVLQAGRARIAVGWYISSRLDGSDKRKPPSEGEAQWVAVAAPQVMTVDGLAKTIAKPSIVAGELTSEERQRLGRKRVNVVLAPPSRCVRRPAILAEMAWQRYAAGTADDPASLAPIYLHAGEPIAA